MIARSRGHICVALGSVTLLITLASRPLSAAPQLSTGLTLGVAGNGDRSDFWSSTGFAMGARGDLLWGRSRDADFGAGPYVEVLTTTGFDDFQAGGGGSLLVPVSQYFPLVLSAGGFASHDSTWGWQPGVAADLFWGSHGYNYHSTYALTAGLFVDGRYALGDSKQVSMVIGARLDFELIFLPFLIAYEAIRGGSPP
jgi:hypothetical protein